METVGLGLGQAELRTTSVMSNGRPKPERWLMYADPSNANVMNGRRDSGASWNQFLAKDNRIRAIATVKGAVKTRRRQKPADSTAPRGWQGLMPNSFKAVAGVAAHAVLTVQSTTQCSPRCANGSVKPCQDLPSHPMVSTSQRDMIRQVSGKRLIENRWFA